MNNHNLQGRVQPETPEAAGILGQLTIHACPKAEHRQLGFSRMIVAKGPQGEPLSRFANGQILFYGCVGCQQEKATAQVEACTPQHNPHHDLEFVENSTTGNPVIFPICRLCQSRDATK